jgi:hypothetical protein
MDILEWDVLGKIERCRGNSGNWVYLLDSHRYLQCNRISITFCTVYSITTSCQKRTLVLRYETKEETLRVCATQYKLADQVYRGQFFKSLLYKTKKLRADSCARLTYKAEFCVQGHVKEFDLILERWSAGELDLRNNQNDLPGDVFLRNMAHINNCNPIQAAAHVITSC